jgi:hypothetical protein
MLGAASELCHIKLKRGGAIDPRCPLDGRLLGRFLILANMVVRLSGCDTDLGSRKRT